MKLACLIPSLVLLTLPVLAQTPDSTATPAPAAKATPAPRPPPLTKDEVAQLNKAYADAIKANPDLASEQKALTDKMKELATEQKALQQKVNAAMIQADSSVAPLLASHPTFRPTQQGAPKKDAKPKPAPKQPKTTTIPSTNAPSATPPTAKGD